MIRYIAACLLTILSFTLRAQSLQSPEQFLGYKIGTHYTPHYKIVNYFKAVAQASPAAVKIQTYGQTNEGRELMLAFIGTPENIQQLDAIRINNLRMAGIDKSGPANTAMPAIVWLSYNVHGNEPSSSEAAMLTLYALVDPSNKQTKEWLRNTLIVIDPCINPDGRDRYVNWFNSVVGAHFNADPQSREHAEPWPGGRSNHYNFDLNRDWVWQTQVETQQRVKQYNAWLPQVHVDFHEQGYNQPYYFAPAAEPFHDVITQWQRDFQVMIGKNNAGYFDQNGWLFFTKERFDLLYPSYGDTYPIYNGAIGMTFEQGGHSRGGLAVVNASGDTLTLVDRAMHHYTTGLSTIETASRNKERLLQEYQKFYTDSRNGKVGEYKTYVLTSKDEHKLQAVAALLKKNGIESGELGNTSFRGFHYLNGKEEAFQNQGHHLAVSAFQPHAVMAKVLLEPRTTVVDSNTYDNTAWSVPYAYGVDAYAVKEKLEVKSSERVIVSPVTAMSAAYGALIPYTSFNAAQVLAHLLQNDIKVRFSEKAFDYKGKHYEPGTLIVLKTSNPANWNEVVDEACKQYNVSPDEVATGFMDKGADFGSPEIKIINAAPKVALLTGEQVSSLGAGEVWHFFERMLNYPLTLLNANEFNRLSLRNYNVLIIPDGFYRSLNDKSAMDKLKEFVRNGGKVIAMENAVSMLAGADWGIKLKEDKSADDSSHIKKYGDRLRESLSNSIPGAIYKLELDNSHPLGFGYPDYYFTIRQDNNLFEFMKDGWNVGVLKKDAYVTGFAGVKVKNKMKDGLVFGVQDMGNGTVVYLADDPLFRNFWEAGKLLFSNAVFLVGQIN